MIVWGWWTRGAAAQAQRPPLANLWVLPALTEGEGYTQPHALRDELTTNRRYADDGITIVRREQ